jgi:hypothetical protein
MCSIHVNLFVCLSVAADTCLPSRYYAADNIIMSQYVKTPKYNKHKYNASSYASS